MIECQSLFFYGVKQIWNNFCIISFKAYTGRTKTSNLHSEITYFFQLSVFLASELRHNLYIIELFRLVFIV